jgi:hypothetical protein
VLLRNKIPSIYEFASKKAKPMIIRIKNIDVSLVAMRAIYGLFLAWQAVSALQMRPTSAPSLAQCVRKAAIPVARRGRGLFVASITVGDQSK